VAHGVGQGEVMVLKSILIPLKLKKTALFS
jgi:hypothetical protein